jgi:hypothetical protein
MAKKKWLGLAAVAAAMVPFAKKAFRREADGPEAPQKPPSGENA